MPSQYYFPPSEVADRIRDGDVLLFEGTRLFSYLIKLVTRSRYSHIGIAVWVDFEDERPPILHVIEAMEGVGVRLKNFYRYMLDCESQRCRVHWYTLADEWEGKIDRQKVVRYATQAEGLPYAPWWQFLLGISWVWKRIRQALGEPLTVSGEWFHCSRLGLQALVFGGYDGEEKDEVPAGMVSPGWVAERPCLRHVGEVGTWRVAK